MIPRIAAEKILALARSFPAVAVIGPRQSGKSTLVRHVFPQLKYVNLEPLDTRDFAQRDPRGFLGQFPDGVIIDEAQRVPDLFAYLQGVIDDAKRPGRFILTGSQNFLLMESVSQSLAGRVAILELLPFAWEEIPSASRPEPLEAALFKGSYPRLFDQPVTPEDWYPAYLQTYVERDVRQLRNVADLAAFRRFVGLCAARTGQILNYASLAADAGISHPTAMSWISLLETSFILHLLRPHHANFNKRLIKMPKLHFIDTGLACSLLGIRTPDQLAQHPLKGAIFESWVVGEYLKRRLHRGLPSNLYYWRDQSGHEVDLLLEDADRLYPIEIKSGQTVAGEMVRSLEYFRRLAGAKSGQGLLFYGGLAPMTYGQTEVRPWRDC